MTTTDAAMDALSSHHSFPELPDNDLLGLARSGDLGAIQELYVRHLDVAVRVAKRCAPPMDAEDVASEAFAAVIKAMRSGMGPESNFRAYLLSTVRRIASRWTQRAARMILTEDISSLAEDTQSVVDPTESAAMAYAERQMIRRSFASLADAERELLWMVEVEGLSYAAVAKAKGMSVTLVHSRLRIARRQLAEGYVVDQVTAPQDSSGKHPSSSEIVKLARGRLRQRRASDVQAHIAQCGGCTLRFQEATEAGSTLRAVPFLLAAFVGPRSLGTPVRHVPWPAKHPVHFAASAVGVATLAVGGVLLVQHQSPNAPGAPVSAPTESVAVESSVPATPVAPIVEAHWSPNTSAADAVPGARVTWALDVVSPTGLARGATVMIEVKPGLTLAAGYAECVVDADVIACPILGPISANVPVAAQIQFMIGADFDGLLPKVSASPRS